MKVTITIEQMAEGVLITMEPGVMKVLDEAEAGQGTAAHHYALCAFRALQQMAVLHAMATAGQVVSGETPPNTQVH